MNITSQPPIIQSSASVTTKPKHEEEVVEVNVRPAGGLHQPPPTINGQDSNVYSRQTLLANSHESTMDNKSYVAEHARVSITV
ncbi:hypothetical protein [Shewanella waksmanii]|uniref:hypothetical protein n=1 Tax=Shewanella waksmanii TaxID=213783 RepID=UPI0012F73DCE|nr:hypothetical protein [Shewanella waksmanii]